MRHAKSSWANGSLSDFDRPLNDRGMRDAPRMATYLAENDLVPDLIISSSAKRAESTTKILNQNFGLDEHHVVLEESLYLAQPTNYLECLKLLAQAFSRPMVVGHNPGLESLVHRLTGESEVMPTACVVHVRLPIDDWADERLDRPMDGEMLAVFRPKEVFHA